jgi:alpha-N-arabinofuranosidase
MIASAPATAGPVTLTIRADKDRMAFDYQTDAGKSTLAENVDVRFLSTKAAGGFVGTVVGPYAWYR